MLGINVKTMLRGPLFGGGAEAVIKAAAEGTVRELTDMGASRLDEMLRPRPAGVFLSVQEARKGQASTGNYRRNIHHEVKSLLGRIDDSKVIYGPWLEGTSSRNQTTRFKGYSSFRRTAQWLGERADEVVRAHVHKAMDSLGGR